MGHTSSAGWHMDPPGQSVGHAGTMTVTRTTYTDNTGGSVGFPTPDQALDAIAAMERAKEVLGDTEGPPDAIRALAERRGEELGVQVSFTRQVRDGALAWRVHVRTRRGIVSAYPSLTEKQQVELEAGFFAIEAWKNAMREVGLL